MDRNEMLAADQHSDLWIAPQRAGARLLALDDSDYLFLERFESGVSLSVEAARAVSTLGAHAPERSVFLLDEDDRVSALLDLDQSSVVPISEFSTIRAVGIAPKLGHELGTWTRHHRRNDGFWLVEFATTTNPNGALRVTLERQILYPWIGKAHKPYFLLSSEQLIGSGAKHCKSLARVQDQLNQVLLGCVLVEGEFGRGKTEALRRISYPNRAADLRKVLVASIQRMKAVHEALYQTLSNETEKSNDSSTGGLSAEASVETVVSKLESATKTLDDISDDLSSATARSAVGQALPIQPSADTNPDPVESAIEIREQLLKTVKLLDAVKWAKWRGMKSSKNPSAALGKYKRQHRVFAVRSGNRDLYPAFQFSENAEPLPIIEKILETAPKDAQGWPLLSWFEAGNALLDDRKPSDVVAREPAAVLKAAARFYSRDD